MNETKTITLFIVLFFLIWCVGFLIELSPRPEKIGSDYVLVKENSVKNLGNGLTEEHLVLIKSNSLEGLNGEHGFI